MSPTPRYLIDEILSLIPTDRYVPAVYIADRVGIHSCRVGQIISSHLLDEVDREMRSQIWWYRKNAL